MGNMAPGAGARRLPGSGAVDRAATPGGGPAGPPASPDAVALLLGTAREEGWRLRVEGAGTWMPADAPADLALTTRRLDKIPAIEPQDLSATAEAGVGRAPPGPPPAGPGAPPAPAA